IGYRLPAVVLRGTSVEAEGHLAAGRDVFWLEDGWDEPDRLMVVAARRWADLPATGKTVFGGSRARDGAYPWDAADCDTDGAGRSRLAETLLVSTVSNVLNLSFKRVQFTPDLMPADITGTDILQDDPETGRRKFIFLHGPIFANMVLADEINRTPPKTQAALLEAMQEHHITAGGQTYHLPEPFFVLATQNPIEQEGTYPLPEAQLDRFMFNVIVSYPSREEELAIMKQ